MASAALALAAALLSQATAPAMLDIAGASVPLAAVQALPRVITDVIDQAPPQQTIKDLLPAIEAVANIYLFPGSGLAIAVIAYAISKGHPMTPDEETLWMDRFSIATQR